MNRFGFGTGFPRRRRRPGRPQNLFGCRNTSRGGFGLFGGGTGDRLGIPGRGFGRGGSSSGGFGFGRSPQGILRIGTSLSLSGGFRRFEGFGGSTRSLFGSSTGLPGRLGSRIGTGTGFRGRFYGLLDRRSGSLLGSGRGFERVGDPVRSPGGRFGRPGRFRCGLRDDGGGLGRSAGRIGSRPGGRPLLCGRRR